MQHPIAQRAAQPGQHGVQRRPRVGWQFVPPGRFDERVGRDRPARAHKQSGQYRAPPPARQRDRHTVPADLQGAKHGEGRYHLIHLTDCG